ncbi:MAG: hypothetical protein ABI181_03940 [Mycobacteriaceae bacterium]
MTLDELDGAVTWCSSGFVDAARARKLPGAYRGERFWHGRATVERHRHWVVVLPLGAGRSGAVLVRFDGSWTWAARPDTIGELTLDEVQAAFDAALDAR